jgi:hypothetical protein
MIVPGDTSRSETKQYLREIFAGKAPAVDEQKGEEQKGLGFKGKEQKAASPTSSVMEEDESAGSEVRTADGLIPYPLLFRKKAMQCEGVGQVQYPKPELETRSPKPETQRQRSARASDRSVAAPPKYRGL